ncbi:MAG: RHS repeat-associated core domain-containing protein [Thermosulfidibacteraceae bacterium]
MYDAWGNTLQSSGTVPNPYLYVGELGYYADNDAGMYLLTQRWYNPVIGRFVVRDPLSRRIRQRGGGSSSVYPDITFYMYSVDNPVISVDPSGLITIRECLDAFWKCMRDAEREYERCMCYMKQAPKDKPTVYGCTALCGGICGLVGWYVGKASGPSPQEGYSTGSSGGGSAFFGGALGALCFAICMDLCPSGVGKLAEATGHWICGRLRDTIKESCYDAFAICRQRIHHVRW